MCEQNPLHIPVPTGPTGSRNRKGRPCKLQSIRFSSPPKSIVSQLIQKMMSQNNVILPINQYTIYDSEQVDLTQDCSLEESVSKPSHTACMERNEISKELVTKKPKIYFCDYSNCSYSSKSSSNLQKHRRRHTEEKPYLCDKCSFRTNFSNSLKVHKRLHTTDRPYQCSGCNYRCNSISNLKKHSFSKHKKKENHLIENTETEIQCHT